MLLYFQNSIPGHCKINDLWKPQGGEDVGQFIGNACSILVRQWDGLNPLDKLIYIEMNKGRSSWK